MVGFSKGFSSVKERVNQFIDYLENKIFKIGPIDEEFRFKTTDINVKVHDTIGRDNREFQMPNDVRFHEFEREIMERYRIDFPIIQFEDGANERITIDSEYAFEHAIKLAVDYSTRRRLDQVYLDVFLSEKPGYIFSCKD